LSDAISVRYVRLEADVRRENIACASGAEKRFRKTRLTKKESNVGGGVSGGIGDHSDRIAAVKWGGRCGGPKVLLPVVILRGDDNINGTGTGL